MVVDGIKLANHLNLDGEIALDCPCGPAFGFSRETEPISGG